jgi:hypothetical protein
LALAALLLLAGCHRARVAPAAAVGVSVPGKCVLGAIVNPVKCKAITNDAVVCDGMVVKLACVESAKP